ncbi:MAG: nucleotide exchange factor GrpE [Lachnospiraceae bacterium]|nr:nucleotide exchange factor GrpE [Lachnospiraceae bacterium]
MESPEQFEEDVSKIIEEEEEKKKSAEEPDDEAVKEDKPEPESEADENQGAKGLDNESEDNAGKDDKKKHHGKKDKKEKKDPRDEKIADLEDRVKRQMAEFENFSKRTDKEKSQMYDMGAKNVIEKILPVIDNFERGLESVPEGSDKVFVDGMQMIYKQLSGELEKLGVKPIEAVGQPFDPNFHNAVMQTESEEYESGTVAQELQKGYMYHDTLVRPSMVSVVS